MLEFHRIISASEVRSYYLNLTDEHGRKFGTHFPEHLTKLAILDGKDGITYAKKHHGNQLWGTLREWFNTNDIQAGTRILVRYDPAEKRDGLSVVHLIPKDTRTVETMPEEEIGLTATDSSASEIPVKFERQIEDFLAANLHLIEDGLKLYFDEDGREGKQYPTDIGTVDLLCQRGNGEYLVIELKRGKSSDAAVGQISRYIGWAKKHIAKEKSVSGLILAHDRDESLMYAVSAHSNLSLRYFRIKLELISEDEL